MSEHRTPGRFTPAFLASFASRRYLYRLGLAVIALLVGYGIVSEQHALLWVALLAPLLGLADDNAH